MKALILVPGVAVLALLLIAGAVSGLDDTRVLVAPPEAVVEGFVRRLETERYELAREQLSDSLRSVTSAGQLREATESLKKRVGEIQDVRGESGWIRRDAAEATAELETAGGEKVPLRFRLTRQQGVWAIDELSTLEGGSPPAPSLR